MTRHDYQKIANAIRETGSHYASDPNYAEGWHAACTSIALRIADVMAEDNPNFNQNLFMKACAL